MRQTQTIDVAELLDHRKLGRFHVVTVLLCFLIFFVEGLDYSSASVAAPAILRAFHAERSVMGVVFGAGNFGFLIGSLAWGYIGDRWGRKIGTITGILAYSLPVLATVFATSTDQLIVFRFITGLGLGGVFPSAIALLNETAPKRFRASFVTFAFVGYACGNSMTGQLGAWLIPSFGWPAMFLVAGIAGVILSAILMLFLPESIRFLAVVQSESAELRRSVVRLAPELVVGADTRFVLRRQKKAPFALRQLFQGKMRITTPLLWLNYFAEGITYLTLLTWLPTLMESVGLAPTQASLAFSYATAGGIVAILVLGRLLDRFGPPATVVTAIGAIVAIAYLGTPGLSQPMVTLLAIAAITCGTGTHSSLHGTVGHFYPTSIRANGVGYATGMSRIASILGPVITGYLLSAHLPMQQVLYLIAAPYVLVVILCLMLGRLYTASADPVAEEAAPAPASSI